MSYKTDLEAHIRESYKLIREYEKIVRLSDDPREKARAQNSIEGLWELIKGYLSSYMSLCQMIQVSPTSDLREIAAHFPEYVNMGSLSISQDQMQEPKDTLEVFFSYAHEDEDLRDELAKQLSTLKQQGLISDWYDRKISPGKDWANEIDMHLNKAHIILLLISADFIASDYCYSTEMKRAMERYATGKARVLPIILRPVDWKSTPFAKLQALPTDGKPVTLWKNRESAFLDIALGIRRTVEELKTKLTS